MAVPDQELTDFPSPNKLIPFSFQNLILLWISSLTLNLLFWLGYCLPIYYIPSCSKPLPGLELSSLIFLPLFWSFLIFFLSPDSPFPSLPSFHLSYLSPFLSLFAPTFYTFFKVSLQLPNIPDSSNFWWLSVIWSLNCTWYHPCGFICEFKVIFL